MWRLAVVCGSIVELYCKGHADFDPEALDMLTALGKGALPEEQPTQKNPVETHQVRNMLCHTRLCFVIIT